MNSLENYRAIEILVDAQKKKKVKQDISYLELVFLAMVTNNYS